MAELSTLLGMPVDDAADALGQQYDGDRAVNVGWDDMQGNAYNGRSNVSPTARDYTLGGVSFRVLGWAVNDYTDFVRQTSHGVKLNTIIDDHIHYCTPTDGTGTKFRMQVEVVAAGVNETFTEVTGSPFTTEIDITEDLTQKHKLSDLCEIPAVNTTVSSLYFIKVKRVPATSNEYGGEVYILFNDGHVQIDQERGIPQEFVK